LCLLRCYSKTKISKWCFGLSEIDPVKAGCFQRKCLHNEISSLLSVQHGGCCETEWKITVCLCIPQAHGSFRTIDVASECWRTSLFEWWSDFDLWWIWYLWCRKLPPR
jgi:hypothetical protein